MLDLLVTLVTGRMGANLRRGVRLAVFAALTATFALIALGGATAAAFLALEARLGPIAAALILAAASAVLAALFSLPLWRPRAPPPSAAATLAQVALAAGLGFLSERGAKKEAP